MLCKPEEQSLSLHVRVDLQAYAFFAKNKREIDQMSDKPVIDRDTCISPSQDICIATCTMSVQALAPWGKFLQLVNCFFPMLITLAAHS